MHELHSHCNQIVKLVLWRFRQVARPGPEESLCAGKVASLPFVSGASASGRVAYGTTEAGKGADRVAALTAQAVAADLGPGPGPAAADAWSD